MHLGRSSDSRVFFAPRPDETFDSPDAVLHTFFLHFSLYFIYIYFNFFRSYFSPRIFTRAHDRDPPRPFARYKLARLNFFSSTSRRIGIVCLRLVYRLFFIFVLFNIFFFFFLVLSLLADPAMLQSAESNASAFV